MSVFEIVFGILLCVISLGIVVAVLMQPGKDKRLSGAIAGTADTYFGKSKAARKEQKLSNLTVVLCVVFLVLIVAMYCIV